MNSLLIAVKKTGAELIVLRRRRAVLRTCLDLTCADLSLVVKNYAPAFATLILDAGHAETQFLPVDRLSWQDRFRLKARACQTSPSDGTLVLSPVFRKVGAPQRTTLVVTACELSPLSRNILETCIEMKIPLKAVDLRQRIILETALKRSSFKTQWACVLSEDSPKRTTLSVWGQKHMVMVRSLPATANLQEEIVRTFQYLERTAYVPSEGITLFCEETLPQIDPRPLGEALRGNVVLGPTFSVPETITCVRHLHQPATKSLHRNYVTSRIVLGCARSLSLIVALVLPWSAITLYREKTHAQTLLAHYAQPSVDSLQNSFQKQKIRSEKRKKWTELWAYNAHQSALKRGGFLLCATLLTTLRKTQIIHSFEWKTDNNQNQRGTKKSTEDVLATITLTASPIALTQDLTIPQRPEVLLQQACFETSLQIQQIVLSQFHRRIHPKGTWNLVDGTFNLVIDFNNAEMLTPLHPTTQPKGKDTKEDKA